MDETDPVEGPRMEEPYSGLLTNRYIEAYEGILVAPLQEPQPTAPANPELAALEARVGPPRPEELLVYRVLVEETHDEDGVAPRDLGADRETSAPVDFSWPDAIDALRDDAKIRMLRALVQTSPDFSPQTNAAVAEIQDRLGSLDALKPTIIGSGYLLSALSKYTKGATSLSGKLVSALGPGAARQMDSVVANRISGISGQQLTRNDLTPGERNFWSNVYELVK